MQSYVKLFLPTISLVMSRAPHSQGQSTGNFGQISKCNYEEKAKRRLIITERKQ